MKFNGKFLLVISLVLTINIVVYATAKKVKCTADSDCAYDKGYLTCNNEFQMGQLGGGQSCGEGTGYSALILYTGWFFIACIMGVHSGIRKKGLGPGSIWVSEVYSSIFLSFLSVLVITVASLEHVMLNDFYESKQ